jgi:6-pyruvoyltetrahydropterin/6-carboxytetrahydropterin synthase
MSEASFPIVTPAVYRYATTIDDVIQAAHQLHLPYPSKCNEPHGHEYRVRVVVVASALNEQGMIVDFTDIKTAVRQYDHHDLNDFFEPTTAEKFGEVLLDQLQDVVKRKNPNARVIEVGIGETRTTIVSVQYASQ